MLTLSSLPSRDSLSCVQLMEVRGRLKSEMETLKMSTPLAITSGEATWLLSNATDGGAEMDGLYY